MGDDALLVDNSGIRPREVFLIAAGEVVAFDIDERNELHGHMARGVCLALVIMQD